MLLYFLQIAPQRLAVEGFRRDHQNAPLEQHDAVRASKLILSTVSCQPSITNSLYLFLLIFQVIYICPCDQVAMKRGFEYL